MTKLENVPFEEALNLTGFGKFNLLTFLLVSSITAGMVFETLSVSYLVPASACELMTTSSQQGFMAGVPLTGIIATSHFWGYLADTRGRRKVLCFSMMLSCVCGAVATVSPHWIFFSVCKFLSCSAIAGALPLSITLLSECTPAEKRFTLIIITTTVLFLCNSLMALITIPILPLSFSYHVPSLGIYLNSWRLLCFIFCVPSAISSIGLMFAYESPKYLLSVGKDDEALKILRAIFTTNNNKSVDEFTVMSLTLDEDRNASAAKGFWPSLKAQTFPLFKPPLLRNTILLSVVYVIVYMCLNPYFTWLPFITDGLMTSVERGDEGLTFCQRIQASQVQVSRNATNIEEIGECSLNKFAMTMTALIGVFLATINTVITCFMKYVGRKNLLIIIQFVSGLAGLLVNITTSWIVGAVFFITFIAGVLNFGFLSTFSVDIFPTYVKAVAVCITLMVGRGSSVFGINILKEMLQFNCETSFYIFGSITILGGILGFLLPAERKPTEKK